MKRKINLNPAHKRQEKEIVEKFRDLYTDFPKARIKSHESPDIQLLINRHKMIGLEIVRYSIPADNNTGLQQLKRFDEHLLTDLITQKEEKTEIYQRMRYTSLWLLIAAGSMQRDALIIYPDGFEDFRVTTDFFDRVFFLDMRQRVLYNLQ
ncbi:MAG: hypothetical protein KJ578_14775 [Bacteroidetes bacterium]|nr:hypothetical protein [Bacteroidota bacterium]